MFQGENQKSCLILRSHFSRSSSNQKALTIEKLTKLLVLFLDKAPEFTKLRSDSTNLAEV